MKLPRALVPFTLAISALILTFTTTACAPIPAKNALYLYLCGSTLETKNGAASKNLTELLEAEIPADTTVVVQTGGAATWRDHGIASDALGRYEVRDGELRLVESLENASMGEARTLEDFLAWCDRTHPAESKTLVLWDHGGGADGTICYDENFAMDALEPIELRAALGENGTRYDLIGLDACLMATLDTAKLLAPYADYLVASQEIEPSGGWDYMTIAESLDDPAAAIEPLQEAAMELAEVKWEAYEREWREDLGDVDADGGYTAIAQPTGESPETDTEVAEPDESAIEPDGALALGQVIADSYILKCDEEAEGMGSMATLSVLDLSKMEAVTRAFDALADALVTEGAGEDGAGFVAVREAAANAEAFGGNSRAEGFSDLIDLGSFASYLETSHQSDAAKALNEALFELVAYTGNGGGRGASAVGSAGGVSLYYPRYYDPEGIGVYEGWSDFASYGEYLDAIYGDDPEQPVSFTDAGSLVGDDAFRIQLTPESKRYVDHVAYELVRVGDDGTRTTLGRDFDFENDPATLTYQSNFRGVWMAIDGAPLAPELLGLGDDTIHYTAPVLVNGMPTNLRFHWRAEPPYVEVDENGDPVEYKEVNGRNLFMREYYVNDGLWDGLDEHELAAKEVTYLQPGDRITPLPYADRYDAETLQGLDLTGLETVTADELCGAIGEIPLEGERFEYTFVVTDIFGNEHRSKTAIFEMQYEGDALMDALLNDAYPAKIVEIHDSV